MRRHYTLVAVMLFVLTGQSPGHAGAKYIPGVTEETVSWRALLLVDQQHERKA